MLAAIQEERTRQHARDHASDSSLEAFIFHALVVIREKLIHILVGSGPAISAFSQGRHDLPGADIRGIAFIGMADENAIATWCRTDSCRTERPQKLEGIDAIQP